MPEVQIRRCLDLLTKQSSFAPCTRSLGPIRRSRRATAGTLGRCATSTAMRRICIAAIIAAILAVILAGTLSGSALAQSLRPSYAPDGASQSAYSESIKRVAHARNVAPKPAPKSMPARSTTAPQNEAAAAAQPYGVSPPGTTVPPNRGLHEFFATIFAGPIMLAHAFRPNESTYYTPMRHRPMRRQTKPIPVTIRSIPNFSVRRSPILAVRRPARSLSIPRTSFFI
jgi:hypothetical protein